MITMTLSRGFVLIIWYFLFVYAYYVLCVRMNYLLVSYSDAHVCLLC
jgi:hypothetical protein